MIVAAAASIGLYFVAKDKKEKDDKAAADSAADLILFSFNSSDVNKVEFTCDDGSYTAELKDSEWELTSGGDFALDQSYLTNVCTYAADLKASNSYSKDDSKTSSYGLDNPSIITLYAGQNSYKLNVGAISTTGEYYYVTIDGRDKVYLVDSLYGSVLKASRVLLRAKDFIPYGDSEVAELSVKSGDKEVYHLTRNKETLAWSLSEKYSQFEFNTTAVDSTITSLTRLKVSLENMGREHPDDLSVYGLDKPDYTVCIKGMDGTERNFLINTKYDNSGSYASVYMKENDQIVFISKGSLSFIEKTPFDFIINSLKNAELNTVSGFDYACGDVSAEFTVDNENKKFSMNGVEFTSSTEFQTFFASLANERLTAIDIDAAPELKSPLLTVVFHNSDGTDKTYQLTDAGNSMCHVFIDGKYTGALVSADNLSGKNSIPYFYNEFIETSKLK